MTVNQGIQAAIKMIAAYLKKKHRDVDELRPELKKLGYYQLPLDIREGILKTAKDYTYDKIPK